MKKIKIFIFTILLLVPFNSIKAETLQDKYDKLSNLQSEYEKNKNAKKLTDSEIAKLQKEISSIGSSIETTKGEITEAQNNIEKSEKEIDSKKEETDELLKFLQVSTGENVYLDYLFEAEDYTDFIYRYSIVTQLSGYNNELIEELETLIKNLKQKKIELNDKQTKLESQRQELTAKNNKLKANLSELNQEGTTIEQDIADLKKEITRLENLGCGRNQDISSCEPIQYANGWKYPLTTGCVTSEYTGFNERTDWSGGGGHHAIDLSCVPEGTNVYAAAAGTVARVVRHTAANPSTCGGNMVWIYHIVNGVEYTTVYMHLLNITVEAGQKVTDQTIIGHMGGGSTQSYDRCTGGAHLHFGLASGHNAYDFNSYSFNPRNLIYFPPMYGGYFYR